MANMTSAPNIDDYRKRYDDSEAWSDITAEKDWREQVAAAMASPTNESTDQAASDYAAAKKGWDKFQADLKTINTKSPLAIKLGEPTKATDPRKPEQSALGAGVDFKSLTSTVSKVLGINTGVQQ